MVNDAGSTPAAPTKLRGWYIDCASAFQADETSLILVPRSSFADVAQW